MMMCHPLGALFTALGTMLAPLAYAALVYPDTPSSAVLVLLTLLGGLASGGLWLAIIALLWRGEPPPDEERADAYSSVSEPRGLSDHRVHREDRAAVPAADGPGRAGGPGPAPRRRDGRR